MPTGQTEVLKDANGNTITSKSLSYTYNDDGYRTSKTVNGTLVQYTLEGSQVRFEKNGSLYLWYYYDASGAPVAFSMQGTPVLYFYRKNLQGDVTGVYKGSTGALLVSYVYDAWGKVTATDVAGTSESAQVLTYNPYLYRGYRYDAETGLYYLSSRYYDPETGRFINADSILDLNHGNRGTNLFTYAVNNPQSYKDKAGTDAILINDFGEEGMPVVGHARLFIQDEAGNWYFTEFAGRNKGFVFEMNFRISLYLKTMIKMVICYDWKNEQKSICYNYRHICCLLLS